MNDKKVKEMITQLFVNSVHTIYGDGDITETQYVVAKRVMKDVFYLVSSQEVLDRSVMRRLMIQMGVN